MSSDPPGPVRSATAHTLQSHVSPAVFVVSLATLTPFCPYTRPFYPHQLFQSTQTPANVLVTSASGGHSFPPGRIRNVSPFAPPVADGTLLPALPSIHASFSATAAAVSPAADIIHYREFTVRSSSHIRWRLFDGNNRICPPNIAESRPGDIYWVPEHPELGVWQLQASWRWLHLQTSSAMTAKTTRHPTAVPNLSLKFWPEAGDTQPKYVTELGYNSSRVRRGRLTMGHNAPVVTPPPHNVSESIRSMPTAQLDEANHGFVDPTASKIAHADYGLLSEEEACFNLSRQRGLARREADEDIHPLSQGLPLDGGPDPAREDRANSDVDMHLEGVPRGPEREGCSAPADADAGVETMQPRSVHCGGAGATSATPTQGPLQTFPPIRGGKAIRGTELPSNSEVIEMLVGGQAFDVCLPYISATLHKKAPIRNRYNAMIRDIKEVVHGVDPMLDRDRFVSYDATEPDLSRKIATALGQNSVVLVRNYKGEHPLFDWDDAFQIREPGEIVGAHSQTRRLHNPANPYAHMTFADFLDASTDVGKCYNLLDCVTTRHRAPPFLRIIDVEHNNAATNEDHLAVPRLLARMGISLSAGFGGEARLWPFFTGLPERSLFALFRMASSPDAYLPRSEADSQRRGPAKPHFTPAAIALRPKGEDDANGHWTDPEIDGNGDELDFPHPHERCLTRDEHGDFLLATLVLEFILRLLGYEKSRLRVESYDDERLPWDDCGSPVSRSQLPSRTLDIVQETTIAKLKETSTILDGMVERQFIDEILESVAKQLGVSFPVPTSPPEALPSAPRRSGRRR
ncbi:hypothetical protein AURDEDRAFT_165511 [Auricularia subglabra TFB-10046 SS5]|nr:hypothetical protein AURDEDRAFT_165511 [Auricularia subglabra TFB-10046 SS5]